MTNTHIDILAVINKKDYIFIEDKTWSFLHNNQLERYYKICNELSNNTPSAVYGYFFELGRKTSSEELGSGIARIDYEDYEKFLSAHKYVNMLTELYFDFYSERISELKEIDSYDIEIKDNREKMCGTSYGQIVFMQRLMQDVMGERYNGYFIDPVTNKNHGSPRTLYRFILNEEYSADEWKFPRKIKELWDTDIYKSKYGTCLFRLDNGKISVRQFVNLKNIGKTKELLDRFDDKISLSSRTNSYCLYEYMLESLSYSELKEKLITAKDKMLHLHGIV